MAQDEYSEDFLLVPIPTDMEARWAQAAKLVEAGCECVMWRNRWLAGHQRLCDMPPL